MWQPSQSILEYFCSSRRKPCTRYWSPSIPQNSLHLYQTQESPIYSFAVSIDLLFWTCHIKGIIPYTAFYFPVFFFCLINRHTFEVYGASLYCVSQILQFFNKLNFCTISALSKTISTIFHSICSLCIYVSHFGNYLNISNFLIITVFFMVICDKILMLLLHKDYNSLKAR